jgi:plastocyanin
VVLGGAVVLQQLRLPGAQSERERRPQHVSRAPDDGRRPGPHAGDACRRSRSSHLRGLSITPAKITVKAGATLKWTNLDATLHNVAITSGPVRFSSPTFNKGGSYKATFTKPGVYHYLCTFHPATMTGTITVAR